MLLEDLQIAGDESQRSVAVFAHHRMRASVCIVAQVSGPQLARFVEVRAFDHEEQLVTDMPVPWQLPARLPAGIDGAPLRGWITPKMLRAYAGHKVGPLDVAQHDSLRGRCSADLFGGFHVTADNSVHGRAISARDAVDTSVGAIADAARRDGARFIADRSFNHVE